MATVSYSSLAGSSKKGQQFKTTSDPQRSASKIGRNGAKAEARLEGVSNVAVAGGEAGDKDDLLEERRRQRAHNA
jgi:hypothetical protein